MSFYYVDVHVTTCIYRPEDSFMEWVLSLHLYVVSGMHSDCKTCIKCTFICWAISPVPKKNFIGKMGLDFEAWKEPQRLSLILRNITGWYNRKIQLLHCCIQSWGLSTPEILCMKGRTALLWSNLFCLVSELSGLKQHKYNLTLSPIQSHTSSALTPICFKIFRNFIQDS